MAFHPFLKLAKLRLKILTLLREKRKENTTKGWPVILMFLKNNTLNVRYIPYYSWANRGEGKMKVWTPLVSGNE